MAKTLPFVSYKDVLLLPRWNIIFSGSGYEVRGAIERAGLGAHFVTVRGDRTRGTIARVLHINEDPAMVQIDLEGTARADVTRVNGDGTAEVEELSEEPADPALLADAHKAVDELFQESTKRRGPDGGRLFLGSAGAVNHMKSLDGVTFSFFWAIGALVKDEGRARLLDLETNDRLRFIVEHVRRTLAG